MRILIHRFDAWLSRRLGIFAFCEDSDCLIRLRKASIKHEITLPDCQLQVGDTVLQIHLWNDHLPKVAATGADLAWARRIQRAFVGSFRLAAGWMQQHPELAEVRAISGTTGILLSDRHSGGARFMQRLGFTILPAHNPLGRFGIFWENFYSWWLLWAYNPPSLRDRSMLNMHRTDIWMCADAFLARYGEASLIKDAETL